MAMNEKTLAPSKNVVHEDRESTLADEWKYSSTHKVSTKRKRFHRA